MVFLLIMAADSRGSKIPGELRSLRGSLKMAGWLYSKRASLLANALTDAGSEHIARKITCKHDSWKVLANDRQCQKAGYLIGRIGAYQLSVWGADLLISYPAVFLSCGSIIKTSYTRAVYFTKNIDRLIIPFLIFGTFGLLITGNKKYIAKSSA